MDFLILRACERLDPRAVFGKSFDELEEWQQRGLLGYDKVRYHEDNRRTAPE